MLLVVSWARVVKGDKIQIDNLYLLGLVDLVANRIVDCGPGC